MTKVSADLLARLPRTFLVGIDVYDWNLIKDLPCGHPFKVLYWAVMTQVSTYADGQLDLLIDTIEQREMSGVGDALHLNTCEVCRQKMLDFLIWYQESLRAFGGK